MPILAILYIVGERGYSHLFTKSRRWAHKAQRGLVPKLQGDGFANEPGGIMEVAMWLCAPLLVGL